MQNRKQVCGLVWEGIKRIWFWLWGHMFACFFYDKTYLKGEWFERRCRGLFAPGWRWVYHDGMARFFKGCNRGIPWPISEYTRVIGWENVKFDSDDLRNFQSIGVYVQAMDSSIVIGKGTWIASGVGIIASNHDIRNPDERQHGQPVILGEKCWIGMNAVILPGVSLGPHTVVGAGAVVTKSFPEGYCVIAGNPAKFIKAIEKVE